MEKTVGIVLRTRPLTETSLIVHWLTPGFGRVATVAKGALRPKSPFRGKLDVFYLAELSFNRSRRSELHTLAEVIVRETHRSLRQSLELLQQVSYGAALIEMATETETPLPEVYDLFTSFLAWVVKGPARPESVFAFELRLLAELGLGPDLEENKLGPGATSLARTLASAPWELVRRVQAGPDQAKELAQFLHGFLIYHLERLPRGRNAALGAV